MATTPEYPVLKVDQDIGNLVTFLTPDDLELNQINPTLAVLLAMCDALCTLEGPAPIQLDRGFRQKAGLNLLISDPVACALIQSTVAHPIRILQGRILREASAKARDYQLTKDAMRKDKIGSSPKFDELLDEDKAERSYDNGTGGDSAVRWSPFGSGNSGQSLYKTENPVRLKHYGDQCARVFASGTTKKALVAQMSDAHLEHLLVYCPLSRVEEASEIDQVVNQLMTGSFQTLNATGSASSSLVAGNLIATVSPAIVKAIADPERCNATWPNRTLWVSSKGFFKVPGKLEGGVVQMGVASAFERAAIRAVESRRIHHVDSDSSIEGLREFHRAFVRDLRALPGSTPEFVAAAMPIFVTLSRGIRLLVKQSGHHCPAFVNNQTIMTLALHVAGCSAVFQWELRRAQMDRMNRELLNKLFSKIAEEEGTTRDLVRRFNRITTPKCQTLLEGLRSLRLVECQSGVWRAIEALPDAKKVIRESTPLIDV